MRLTLPDDRGRRVPVCTPAHLQSESPREVRRAVNAAAWHRPAALVNTSVASLGVVAGLLAYSYFAGSPSRRGILFEAGVLAGTVVCAVAVGALLEWVDAWMFGGARIRRTCLEHSVCPSCGYTLAGTPLQDDGCAVCPECAAAWRPPTLEFRCRRCKYDLKGAPRLEDGRAACPECGADSWPPVKPAPAAPPARG